MSTEEQENFESVFYCNMCQYAVDTVYVHHYWTEEEVASGQSFIYEEHEINREVSAYCLRKCPKCESPFLHKYDWS